MVGYTIVRPEPTLWVRRQYVDPRTGLEVVRDDLGRDQYVSGAPFRVDAGPPPQDLEATPRAVLTSDTPMSGFEPLFPPSRTHPPHGPLYHPLGFPASRPPFCAGASHQCSAVPSDHRSPGSSRRCQNGGGGRGRPARPQLQTQEDLERRVRQLEEEVRQLIAPGNFADAASGRSAFRRVTAAEVIDQQPLAASGRNDDLTDPGFLKSVPLFGSRYRFSFGGYVKVDLLHDFSGTGMSSSSPCLRSRSTGRLRPAATTTSKRLKPDSTSARYATPSSCAPHNRVFLEFDFFDEV